MTLLLLPLACTGSVNTSDTGWTASWRGTESTETDTPTDSTDTDPPMEFVGSPPLEALGLPEFSVSNQYGLLRSADFLEGSPVALWFFTTGWTDC